MVFPLLAETIGPDTPISIGLVISVVLAVAGAATAAIVARVKHGTAIDKQSEVTTELKANTEKSIGEVKTSISEAKASTDKRLDAVESRLRAVEDWKLIQEALDEAAVKASASTTKGTLPYPTRGG